MHARDTNDRLIRKRSMQVFLTKIKINRSKYTQLILYRINLPSK
jgi:hypothetical protein